MLLDYKWFLKNNNQRWMLLFDWAETDNIVRELAKQVLDEQWVDGDSYDVPSIEDIVEQLVLKIKFDKKEP